MDSKYRFTKKLLYLPPERKTFSVHKNHLTKYWNVFNKRS